MKTIKELQKENQELKERVEKLLKNICDNKVIFMHLSPVLGIELSTPQKNPYKSKNDIEFNGKDGNFIYTIAPYERTLTITTDNGDFVLYLHADDEDSLKIKVSSKDLEV